MPGFPGPPRFRVLVLVALLSCACAPSPAATLGVTGLAPLQEPQPSAETATPAAATTEPTSSSEPTALASVEPTPTAPTTEPTTEPSTEPTTEPATPVLPAEPQPAPQQVVGLAVSKLLLGSDVVQVGQYLTFTILVTNTGTTTITDVPLVDEYEATILEPALDRTLPPPSSSGPGVLRWDNLAALFGDLGPGESVAVTTVFRALRIDDEVINRARVEAGSGSGGGGGAPIEDSAGGEIEGGRVIVTKQLVESLVNLATPVISFTIALRNDGYADIVRLPFADTYRADLLAFAGSSIPPDSFNAASGELRWTDVLASLGITRLGPGQVISFTTVYTVIAPIEDAVVNGADAVDVADEFGNQVFSPQRAEVRIRIAGPATTPATTTTPATPAATTVPAATPRSNDEGDEDSTAAPTAGPAATAGSGTATGVPATGTPVAPSTTVAATALATEQGATPASTAAATPTPLVPLTLPATGGRGRSGGPLALAALALAAGAALWWRTRRRGAS